MSNSPEDPHAKTALRKPRLNQAYIASRARELRWMLALDGALFALIIVNAITGVIQRQDAILYMCIVGLVLSGWGIYRSTLNMPKIDEKYSKIELYFLGFYWLLFVYVIMVPFVVR